MVWYFFPDQVKMNWELSYPQEHSRITVVNKLGSIYKVAQQVECNSIFSKQSLSVQKNESRCQTMLSERRETLEWLGLVMWLSEIEIIGGETAVEQQKKKE